MRLEKIKIKNFRCYEEVELKLKPNYTVLVGINGSGKTSILDAISISLGGYISNFDGMGIYGIHKEDSHYRMFELGSKIEREHQFPVEIISNGIIDNKEISWKRALNKEKGRTTTIDAKEIISYADRFYSSIKQGDKDIVLPLIAYYGTGRLWMQKRGKSKKNSKGNLSRIKGYTDCLDSASNEKLMLEWFEEMTYLELQEGKKIPELETVREALNSSYKLIDESIENVNFAYKVKSKELEVEIKRKDNSIENLPLRLLSDGIKSTMSMMADIAYRMAMLNPESLNKILKDTPGVVLIDEIDMHLHPSWQSKIIKILTEIFPKIQFIFTTHSPSILVNIPNENILILDKLEIYNFENKTYGRDIESILREVMKVEVKPKEIIEKLEKFNDLLDEGKVEKAKKLLEELENVLGKTDEKIVEYKLSLELEELEV